MEDAGMATVLVDDILAVIDGYEQQSEQIRDLEAQLRLAVTYLKAGKRQFTPTTTNSNVDMFIKRHSKAAPPQKESKK